MQATNMVLMKNAPHPGHVFKTSETIFKLVRDIIGTHCLTKCHEDETINAASSVKNAPPPGANVFQPTGTNFDLTQYIIGTQILTSVNKANVDAAQHTANDGQRLITKAHH
ncbi:hypothetical protein DPMN_164570 [Dreissena polymorpha]|uniref:Uncharacterized protein n=1 Tax=Dreissena polymorpha TaxID=45954 RepID=A0A9D4EW49_DREPO|nr:hypothetical protein DPMN_164570 [Dreissena polymorpha]